AYAGMTPVRVRGRHRWAQNTISCHSRETCPWLEQGTGIHFQKQHKKPVNKKVQKYRDNK
ncbi:hypothetical protein, partial [Candidatus Magnetobacterium casense]|uniref:hypothetical protein n=1 Tax=Candidatus Magnetobacterium casense TaxID=1455061 RepID=UPI001C4482A8